MKYPLLKQGTLKALTISEFSGGVNLREAESNILDNQLTDCENMVFLDGELKTRWGISNANALSGVLEEDGAKITPHDVFLTDKTGNKGRVVSVYLENAGLLKFFLFSKSNVEQLPSIECSGDLSFLAQYQSTLYLFLDYNIYTLTQNDTAWVNVKDKIYVPTVAVDCKYAGGGFSGVFNESFNILADSYSLSYTTKNPDWHNPLTDSVLHEMTYLNYFYEPDCKKYAGRIIKAELRDGLGEVHTHTVTLDSNGFGKETASTDGYYMSANINGVTFFTDPEFYNIAYKNADDELIQNDLTVTFPTLYDNERLGKVFKCAFCTWFGGGKGIYGGSRLFIGGNTLEPNLVHWSDLNNPLYFPENNHFYVGSLGKVQALKPQSDMLVIFKDSEIYFTKYTQDTTITASDVISGRVVDYLAQSVYFPLTLINSNIGCDCPNTIQLCKNRLVWVNTNGRVYTLQSADKYSENNIYEIGQLIHKRLCCEQHLNTAVSADFDGKYLLLIGQNLYVFNYNCYGYANVASYTKTEDANLKTEWYFCTLPTQYYKNTALILTDSSLFIAGVQSNSLVYGSFCKDLNADWVILKNSDGDFYTKTIPIKSMFKTKQFEFNAPFLKKDVLSVRLSVKGNENCLLGIEYICDNFTKTAQIGALSENGNSQSIKLYPFIKQTKGFGIKVKTDGAFSLQGINIKVKITKGE